MQGSAAPRQTVHVRFRASPLRSSQSVCGQGTPCVERVASRELWPWSGDVYHLLRTNMPLLAGQVPRWVAAADAGLDSVPVDCANGLCRRFLHVSNIKHLGAEGIGWVSCRPSQLHLPTQPIRCARAVAPPKPYISARCERAA